MNANELLQYLRGFFEMVSDVNEAQINNIRNVVLAAHPVENEIVPVEMHNPTLRSFPAGGCSGCSGSTSSK